jgi:hypothetical protein
MNLVQINERLKDLPEQVIRQYANGMNPEVPPYLALGELQRRELANKQMATAQGGQQGPQPSIKEQVEQRAGLMALQQMQQQQMQPQPQGPMPVPAGVPQPEPQPQAPQMMARGGLASIPVRRDMFEYAGGGIIPFQEGGQSPKVITIPRGTSDEEIDRIRRENPDAILRPEADVPMPSQSSQPSMPAQQPTQMKPGAVQRSPLMDQAVSVASQMPERPTAEGVNAGIAGLLPPELQDAARKKRAEEAQARMAESQKAYESSKPTGLDNLIRTFGQAGQYKGLSGLGPAYTQTQDQQRARDAAFRKEQETMRSGAEKQQLEEAAGLFGARSKDYSGQMEGYRKQLASRTESLAGLAGADQRAIDAALGRMSDKELTEMRIAADKANASRPGAGERITAQILKLRAQGKIKEADDLLQTYGQVQGSGVAGVGAQRNAISEKRLQLASWKDIRDNGETEAERKEAAQKILQITRDIQKLESGEDASMSMTMDDVRATAKSSGKSETEVIAAAKARGYTIK